MEVLNKMSLKGKVKLAVGVIFCFFLLKACLSDSSRNSELESSQDPSRIAFLLIDYSAEEAQSMVRVDDTKIEVEFKIDPWALTASTAKTQFLNHSSKLVEIYFSRFPEINIVKIASTSSFTDVKGNESREYAMEIAFSRGNAKSINWDNVLVNNLPQLANSFWAHPAFDAG